MTIGWVDRTIFTATSAGLGDFVVASSVQGYLTPAQSSAIDGDSYHYAAQIIDASGNITEWEVGTGVYTASTTTLARTTVEFSSNSNNKVNFSIAPQVMLTALAVDFLLPRQVLLADRTYYVRTDGSNANTGLANTAAGAFLTIQHAIDVVTGDLDLRNFSVTIQVGAGIFAEKLIAGGYLGGSAAAGFDQAQVSIIGQGVTTEIAPALDMTANNNLGLFAVIDFICPASWLISSLYLTAENVTGGYCDLLGAWNGSVVHAIALDYGSTFGGGAFYELASDSFVYINGNHTSDATQSSGFALAAKNSFFQLGDGNIQFDNNINWGVGGAFLSAVQHGQIDVRTITISGIGIITGDKLAFSENSSIFSLTDISVFPGNSVGSVDKSSCFNGNFGLGPGIPTTNTLVLNTTGIFKATARNPILFANDAGVIKPITREQLLADRTYFVATTGNDTTGDGSVGNPWATPQHAADVISGTLDMNGHNITVQLADGTYTNGLYIENFFNSLPNPTTGVTNAEGSYVLFTGNAANASSVVINSGGGAFVVVSEGSANAAWTFLSNMTLDASDLGFAAGCVFALGTSSIGIGDPLATGVNTVRFIGGTVGVGVGSGGDMLAANFLTIISVDGNIEISGVWDVCFRADYGGQHQIGYYSGTANVNFTAATTAPVGLFWAGRFGDYGAIVIADISFTNPGNFTGKQYDLRGPGSILDLCVSAGTPHPLSLLPGTTGTLEHGATVIYKDSNNIVRSLRGDSSQLAIQLVGPPTTAELEQGAWDVFKDTSGGGLEIAYNDGGTIKPVALSPSVTTNITTGYTVTPGNGGTLATGGTFTATAVNGNYQYYTNNGAHTFANPSADCAIDVLVTNGAAAGAITFSTFTVGSTGDALTTTSGNKFIISTRRINGTSTYLVKALQ